LSKEIEDDERTKQEEAEFPMDGVLSDIQKLKLAVEESGRKKDDEE